MVTFYPSIHLDKIYTISILEEEKGKSNITRDADIHDKLKIDKQVAGVLAQAKLEFAVSPKKCRDLLIQEKITDYSALHFAKVLYTQPFGLVEKCHYLYDTKDEFAIGVRDCFTTLFSLKDLTLKELLLRIHTKVSPPIDSDKKSKFYQSFCDEY